MHCDIFYHTPNTFSETLMKEIAYMWMHNWKVVTFQRPAGNVVFKSTHQFTLLQCLQWLTISSCLKEAYIEKKHYTYTYIPICMHTHFLMHQSASYNETLFTNHLDTQPIFVCVKARLADRKIVIYISEHKISSLGR